MTLKFNGTDMEVEAGKTVAGLLEDKKISRKNLIIEYNGQLLDAEESDSQILQDGDQLNLFSMVGGG